MKHKKAFTLIELIIATGILTITVFGIYKLISENNKIINKSNNSLSSTLLFPVIEACLDNLKINTNSNIGDEINIFIGEDLKKCEISNQINLIDNIEYSLKAKKIDTTTWETYIMSDYIKTLTGSYIQKK